jgi:O-antigen ligase
MVWSFLAVAVLSATRAIHPAKSAKDVFQFVEYFVVTFMLFAGAPNRERLRRLVDVFLVAASVVILLAAIQYLSPNVVDFKVRATFANRNVLGGYLALLIPLLGGLVLYEACWWRRVWMGAMAAAGLLVTLSGGALLAIVVALAVVAMLRGSAAFAVVAAVLIAGCVWGLPHLPRSNDVVLNESVRLFNDNNEVSLRYTEWQAAMVMTAENPLLGVGMGNYQDNIGGYFGVLPRPTGVVEHDSENLYLVLASSVGLPGLACWLGVLLTFGIRALRAFFAQRDGFEKGLALGLAGAILSFAICCIWTPLLVRGIGIQLAVLFAFASLIEPPEERTAA